MMWLGLFNLRGSDISFNPVFISYAVVTVDKAHLFVNPSKLTDEGPSIRALFTVLIAIELSQSKLISAMKFKFTSMTPCSIS
jgi:hypothetical protein